MNEDYFKKAVSIKHHLHIALIHTALDILGFTIFSLHTGCFRKNGAVFILPISWQPSIGFSNRFFLLKTKIHTQILNTKPFLCAFRGLRNLQNKIGFLIKLLCSKIKLFDLEVLYNLKTIKIKKKI